MGNIIIKKIINNCAICNTTYLDDYNNPVFKIQHIGKYHECVICKKCFLTKFNLKNI